MNVVAPNKDGDQSDEDQYTLEEEWTIVGRAVDYILFLVFVVVFLLGTIICFIETKYIY